MESLFFRRLPQRAVVAALVLGLAGCAAVGPDYQPPTVRVPNGWQEAQHGSAAADAESLRQWWRSFNDPLLDRLIARALDENQDLAIAAARLRQARAEREVTAAGLGPTLSVGGSGEAGRVSTRLDSTTGGHTRTWQAGLDASWELDLFGGTRRAVEAADADVGASAADLGAAQVSLLAELATDYADLRTAQRRLAVAEENIRTLAESERLAGLALGRGLGTAAELLQARAERESAQAQPPQLAAEVARLSHAIGVLAGGFPGDWRAALAEPAAQRLAVPALPSSLPSDLLRQRPDLRADERRLAAASAQIGVAEAARFPQFTIPLGIGSAASLLHDLFSGASLAWSAGMQAGQTLYDGGRARAGVTAQEAAADAARLAWQRDVRLALRDVENALTQLNAERQRQAALTAAVGDGEQALARAMRLYRQGLIAWLPVLTAQRSLSASRDALAQSQGEALRGAIALYKALGAGWQG